MNNEQAIELFIEAMKEEGKSKNTIKNYLSDLKTFEKFTGVGRGDGVLSARQNDITKYTQQLEKSGLAKTTINRRLQTLRTFYAKLSQMGVIETNPTIEIKAKKVARQNETKWLERHQVRAIFEAIDKQKQGEGKRALQRAIFSVLVNCGLRIQELCDIKMNDIDWNSGLISVVGKGGKFRKVPFNNATQRAVLKWLQYRNLDGEYLFHSERSDHMTPRAVQHMTKKLSEQLNFDFTVHQLRHTALKNIADTTGKIEIVATVAGHENVNTSKRYIEPSLKEIGEAMKRSEFDF
ncbi:tyrosine-type recombinase/integrase [Cytobacillus pseudoceanisediminis]|uniref:tyrosine-type recombinase/integrase n=1 Tax=Cytobacillus pseudoceanisediminis TaxID=3051614 RepID=UPI003CFBA25E